MSEAQKATVEIAPPDMSVFEIDRDALPDYLVKDIKAMQDHAETDSKVEPSSVPTEDKPFKFFGKVIMVTNVNYLAVTQIVLDAYFLRIENLTDILKKFAFQSFDPKEFMPHFLEFAKRVGQKPALVAMSIIAAFVMRGTNVVKMGVKSTPWFKAMLSSWTTNGLRQASDSADVVTVGRVAALYPQYTCYVNAFALQNKLKDDFFPSTTLPLHYRFTGAPSIMSDEAWERNKEAYYGYMRSFTILISKDRRNNKVLSDEELEKRMNTVKSIADSQRKNQHHRTMRSAYLNFLVSKKVCNSSEGFCLEAISGAPLVEVREHYEKMEEIYGGPGANDVANAVALKRGISTATTQSSSS